MGDSEESENVGSTCNGKARQMEEHLWGETVRTTDTYHFLLVLGLDWALPRSDIALSFLCLSNSVHRRLSPKFIFVKILRCP